MVIQGGFRGAGDTRIAMVLSLLAQWGFRIPVAAVLAFAWTVTVPGVGVTITALDWGVEGLWWSYAAGAVVSFLLGAVWFLRGSWKQNVISRGSNDREAPGDSEEARSSPGSGSGVDTGLDGPGDG
jgi:Na+-driven multidrug efflux pump